MYLIKDNTAIVALSLANEIRQESYETIAKLKAMAIKTAMLTGDYEDVGTYVAHELGLVNSFPRFTPKTMQLRLKSCNQFANQRVTMVGDGVNNALALTQADVAIEPAGFVLVLSDPSAVAKIIELSKVTYPKTLHDLAWVVGYNALALPLAAGVTAALGFVLSPAFGVMLMSISTIVAAVNARFLLKLKI